MDRVIESGVYKEEDGTYYFSKENAEGFKKESRKQVGVAMKFAHDNYNQCIKIGLRIHRIENAASKISDEKTKNELLWMIELIKQNSLLDDDFIRKVGESQTDFVKFRSGLEKMIESVENIVCGKTFKWRLD